MTGNAGGPGWSRRDFIRTTMGAGALGALPGCATTVCPDPDTIETIDDEAGVVIVGSGFGGAITAARLTAAGIPVTLVEKGRRWDVVPASNEPFSPSFPADRRSTWLSDRTRLPIGIDNPISRYVGVLERQVHDGIDVYNGVGYGGGSLVYGGMTVQPDRSLFEQHFPSEIDYAELDAVYFPRVRTALGASPMPADVLAAAPYQAVRLFEDEVRRAGLDLVDVATATDWEVIRAELAGTVPASATIGELIFGNNSGSKNSLDRNYLQRAERTGIMTVHLLTAVRTLSQLDDGRYVVECATLDEHGCTIGRRRLTCRHLFLAAGSIGTTSMLVRARETGALPAVHSAVGQGWGNNGNVMFMRDDLGANTGSVQGGPPARGISALASPAGPCFVEHAQFPSGFECRCMLHLALGINPQRGAFDYDAAADVVTLRYPANGNVAARRAAAHVIDQLNAANGGQLASNSWIDGLHDGFTYHPLGGAVIGQACDFSGRVLGYSNLYVMDGSLIPGTTVCANPSLVIGALAERSLDRLLDEESFI